ncbi:MAG TPA: phosphoglucosamine mutase [Bacteroidales bacterium]|nr:phosphoglucosamine mutase [Bacteroidales bacterium]HNS45915.1 phosphoglucosamine mutase [Bacteroidales bacterium]
MALIKSISGIRGTLGGTPGDGLTPPDIMKFTIGFAKFLFTKKRTRPLQVVIGRDARPSGEMVSGIVSGTLLGLGIHVIDLGLTTTPTLEIAVMETGSTGGIMITASHNAKHWNALKLMNRCGEFLSAADGNKVLQLATTMEAEYATLASLGCITRNDTFLLKHIEKILRLPLVNVAAIRKADFRIVVDPVNSTGGIAVPLLLEKLGVKQVVLLNGEVNGDFAHPPEPLPENLSELSGSVVRSNAHLGFAVDPDVDRLAIVQEDGEMFGEEYTLVAVADYVLKHQQGNTVSNMSSTRALKDITEKAGGNHYASAVGEVNVVRVMKEVKAVIGGEGNGGIIYPDLHYGRDALVGIALFLSHLALSGRSCSALKSRLPYYYLSKNKINVPPDVDLDNVFKGLLTKYASHPINREDGVRIEFDRDWVHIRKSNTEPVMRIYAESDSQVKAEVLVRKIIADIGEVIRLN